MGGVTAPDPESWLDRYRVLETPRMEPVMTGFNVNLDRSIPVTAEILGDLIRSPPGIPEFLPRFLQSIRRCTSGELFVPDGEAYCRFSNRFAGSGTLAIGGQAGIAAVHLASAGAPGVTCLAPAAGKTTRNLLRSAGVTVPGTMSPEDSPDLIHLVFECPPCLLPPDPGVVPRKSRFIVSPLHPAGSVLLPEPLLREAETAAARVRRLFLSGYQYLTSAGECIRAADQVRRLRERNPALRVHAEWVSADDPALTGRFLRFILPVMDSLGMNEHELATLSRQQDPARQPPGPSDFPPATVLQQAYDLGKTTGLERLHVHAWGYYGVVHRCSRNPEGTRDSLLFASREAVRRDGGGDPHLVPEGIRALGAAAELFSPTGVPGIFSAAEGFQVIVVPALVDGKISRTAGLGDRISSAAFAADPF
jgi:ADP-dependent phosphofructokinase/glucokinase